MKEGHQPEVSQSTILFSVSTALQSDKVTVSISQVIELIDADKLLMMFLS